MEIWVIVGIYVPHVALTNACLGFVAKFSWWFNHIHQMAPTAQERVSHAGFCTHF